MIQKIIFSCAKCERIIGVEINPVAKTKVSEINDDVECIKCYCYNSQNWIIDKEVI